MPARNKCCRFVVPQVVRSRLQQRMARRAIRYRSGLDVLRITLRREGVGGLYKGLLPNVLRVMPQVQFHGLEQWNALLCLLLRGPLGALTAGCPLLLVELACVADTTLAASVHVDGSWSWKREFGAVRRTQSRHTVLRP